MEVQCKQRKKNLNSVQQTLEPVVRIKKILLLLELNYVYELLGIQGRNLPCTK